MIVLDTNVLSELVKPEPSVLVSSWFTAQQPQSLFTTAITQAELMYGVEIMEKGRRRSTLDSAIKSILAEDLADRVLPFDSAAADAYALIAASRRAIGRPISETDAQIAATAQSHGAILATRNVKDFQHCGIKVINPWTG